MSEAGILGLFLSAFVSATLVPMSSEAVLAGLIAAKGWDTVLLILVATAGNTLGSVVNWILGQFCLHWRHSRWFPVSEATLEKGSAWFRRFGTWSLLFAWLPVIGDPLTFAAGIARVRFPLFLALVLAGKFARYAVVGAVSQSLFG
jgi:membrane protein YqaA with SNARE-associated domain